MGDRACVDFYTLSSLAYHAVGLALNLHFLAKSQPLFDVWWFQFKFLTQITHICVTLFFGIAFFHDMVNLAVKTDRRQRKSFWPGFAAFLDHVFVLFLTVASMVAMLFWSIYFYDPNLILPEAAAARYPFDLNIFQHGITSVLLWIELFVVEHQYRSMKHHMSALVLFALAYIAWGLVLKSILGTFPYTFQEHLTLVHHVIFNLVSSIIGLCVLYLGRVVATFRWGKVVVKAKPSQKGSRKHAKQH